MTLPACRDWTRPFQLAVAPARRVAVNMVNPASRGQRLRTGCRTLRHEIQTRAFRRPTTLPLGERSEIIARPGETNSPLACRNPPNWEMVVWQQLLHPGDLFLDVGANIGIYTIMACELGAHVIAFEPDAYNAGRIRENLALNGYTAEVVQQAVADRGGPVRFTEGLDSFNHLTEAESGVEVQAIALDDVIGERHVAGIKIDVEGAEHLVLKGAERALASHRIAVLQIEWDTETVLGDTSAGRGPVNDVLRANGYLTYRLSRRGHLYREEDPKGSEDVFAAAVDSSGNVTPAALLGARPCS